MISPSIRKLQTLPGISIDQAREMKRVFLMNRREMLEYPGIRDFAQKFYNPAPNYILRMEILNRIFNTHGLESFETRKGEYVQFLNVGDPYILTIIRFRGNYRVSDWGSIAEIHGSK
jgi:hypothetical protein